ncbi:MAG: hypothetical protein RIT19_1768 [Verrucomicrobiota bacterium]|jgi:hypothetical protein
MVKETPARLKEVREALLELHKTLLESERVGYEAAVGPIPSPNHFLRLLSDDPWFAWLHPLSRHIVSIDEALDRRIPVSAADAEGLMAQTRRMLVASEEGHGFPRSYFEALQRDPDVVFAHSRVVLLLR